MKKIVYILVFFMGLTSCLKDKDLIKTEAPEEGSSPIVMNEVMSTGAPDWIELYNTSSEAVDITGFTISDSGADYVFETGTAISANGYLVILCDKGNTVDPDGTIHTNFKISSGGESLSLKDSEAKLIDEVDVPAMDDGLTWGRESDGADTWVNMSPTPGAPNSTVNNPPILVAEPLTEFTDVYSVIASDADGIASVKLVYMVNDGVLSLDMSLVDGKYKTSVPATKVGDVVKYYVIATDKTGLSSVYPEDGTVTPGEFTVVGGIKELVFEGTDAGYRGIVTFSAVPYHADEVDEVRLYYFLPGQTQDDKEKIIMTKVDGVWTGDIPAQNTDDVVSYYLRVEYTEGTKTYYPMETYDADGNVTSDFNHDIGTTWPTYTVEAIVYDDVEETIVTYTDGPLTSVTFPSNPVPGTSIPIVMEYTSSETILEARVYFDVGNAPVYVKANKLKGEDEDGFTQTGVTVDFKGVVADNGLPADGTGNKVSFYIRIATANAEYYYGNDGTMYLDDTPGGGTTDQSDAFKADPSLWNVYNVQ